MQLQDSLFPLCYFYSVLIFLLHFWPPVLSTVICSPSSSFQVSLLFCVLLSFVHLLSPSRFKNREFPYSHWTNQYREGPSLRPALTKAMADLIRASSLPFIFFLLLVTDCEDNLLSTWGTHAQKDQVAFFAHEEVALWGAATLGRGPAHLDGRYRRELFFAGIFMYSNYCAVCRQMKTLFSIASMLQ